MIRGTGPKGRIHHGAAPLTACHGWAEEGLRAWRMEGVAHGGGTALAWAQSPAHLKLDSSSTGAHIGRRNVKKNSHVGQPEIEQLQ
eukprot:3723810-Alexandrium_andersonii.AAC.1